MGEVAALTHSHQHRELMKMKKTSKYVPNKGKKSPETNSNETEIHDLPDG